MVEKEQEISSYNQQKHWDLACRINGRRLTNIGSFRAYLERYLRTHPNIHQDMTLMVRQLAPTHDGISLEVYCFTNTTVWVEYERIQSDILIISTRYCPSLTCASRKPPQAMTFAH